LGAQELYVVWGHASRSGALLRDRRAPELNYIAAMTM